MLQAAERLAKRLPEQKREISGCVQTGAKRHTPGRSAMRAMYRMPTGPVSHVGRQMRARGPNARRELFPNTHLHTGNTPSQRKLGKSTLPKIHKTTAISLPRQKHPVLHVRRIRGAAPATSLPRTNIRNGLRGHHLVGNNRARGSYLPQRNCRHPLEKRPRMDRRSYFRKCSLCGKILFEKSNRQGQRRPLHAVRRLWSRLLAAGRIYRNEQRNRT